MNPFIPTSTITILRTRMALALNEQQKVNMPLNKEIKPNITL